MSSLQGKYGCRANMMTGLPFHARRQQQEREVVGAGMGVVQAKIDSRSFPLTNWGELPSASQYLLSLRNKKEKKLSGFAKWFSGKQSECPGWSQQGGSNAPVMRESDESSKKKENRAHRRSLPGPHFTVHLSLCLSHLPFFFLKKKNPCTPLMCMHTHVTCGSIHCGNTCERNLHFQLNCWPSLQNATLDSAPSSPARLLLLRQPLGTRWKRLLHHAQEKH